MTRLAPLISGFLRDHMPRQRGCSPHSCETYAHSFRLLFAFVAKRTGTKPSQLHVEQLDAALILDFLTHLEQERGNRAVTIFDRDTRFQIAAEFADKFEEAARNMKPNEGRIARVDGSGNDDAVPMHAAPARKNGKDGATATAGAKNDAGGTAPLRGRAKARASDHPHGKGGKPQSHRNGPRPHTASPTSTGAPKGASKYADKKKRAAPRT
jgi:hypothetical protein